MARLLHGTGSSSLLLVTLGVFLVVALRQPRLAWLGTVPRRVLTTAPQEVPLVVALGSSAAGHAAAVNPAFSSSAFAAALLASAGLGLSAARRPDAVPGRCVVQALRAEKEDGTAAPGKEAAAPGSVGKSLPHHVVEELEGKMHKLAQAGDYKSAAAVRDELSAAQLDDEGSVLLANTEFYAAFTARDIKRMKSMWLQAPFVQCIHPYFKRSTGYTDICSSFQKLFESSTKKSGILAEDVKVNVRGATATVTCTEQIVLKQSKKPVRAMLASSVATNIFRKVAGRWLMVHRHVSYMAGDAGTGFAGDDSDAMEMQMNENAMANFRMQQFQFQQLVRAAQSIGGSQIIIKQLTPTRGFDDDDDDDDDDEDSPFGIASGIGSVHAVDDDELEGEDEDEDEGSDEDDELYVEEESDAMEDAQNTVRALRKLEKSGRLSPQAKVQLMADMIRNPGESMPERAHALLLSNVPDDEQNAAWEDFAALVASEAKRLEVKRASGQSKSQGKK